MCDEQRSKASERAKSIGHALKTSDRAELEIYCMKYSDQEIRSVALAILNADRSRHGWTKLDSVDQCNDPGRYFAYASVAIQARDQLFEKSDERWEVRFDDGSEAVVDSFGHADGASECRASLCSGYKVVHVVTTRKKRR